MNITVAIGSRANWGSLRSACIALRRRGATVRPVLFASALSDRFGDVRASLKADGFDQYECLSSHIDGDVTDMAKVAGLAAFEWSTYLRNRQQDAVLVVGDRHEVLGAAMAVAYANVRLGHVMGGERTGSIDDKVRDAITALADVHCVATHAASLRVSDIVGDATYGDNPAIRLTGCPRIDTVKEALEGETRRAFLPMLMVSQHPVTTEWQLARAQMAATLDAVGTLATERGYSVELFWPNGDAGTGGTSEAIRAWLNGPVAERLTVRTHRTMGPAEYARMMAATKCLVGNSSSGIREGAWIGTPVVQAGTRQSGRECAGNVLTVANVYNDVERVEWAIRTQVDAGPRPCSTLYGDGAAGDRVADAVMGEGT